MTVQATSSDRADYEDPRITRSRALIMAAAARVFIEHGYPGTSVDDIAVEAGVSKRTVYNVFDDKEQLFRAIIGEAIATAERFSNELVATTAEAPDAAAALTALARELAASVLGGRVVPLRRLLIGEARRFPEFATEYYDRAPGRVMTAVAGALRAFDQRGQLRVDDAELAAEHFAFLTIGASLDRALFEAGTDAASADAAIERAERGAAAFLRAYAP
ncbi:TetR/AcrR family transcriptional regulator [Agromyces sp. Soil535]|uniref:TetR/AcrR family transcriptional regulator n=1 Tax=Agromyces sp. Soil535 TaxID=1736390 RepID=UPI000A505588|nr:TetR/AcrR family transcriptional regulator [Agromyces sp. Soil535]